MYCTSWALEPEVTGLQAVKMQSHRSLGPINLYAWKKQRDTRADEWKTVRWIQTSFLQSNVPPVCSSWTLFYWPRRGLEEIGWWIGHVGPHIQSATLDQFQGFVLRFLGRSIGWWADTTATKLPDKKKLKEQLLKNINKHRLLT